MEFLMVPGAKGRGQRLIFSTDVDCMHIGTLLDRESRAWPCLTVHYADEQQLQLIWEIADEARRAQIKPRVYLNRLPGHADITFAFELQFQGQFAALVRGIMRPGYDVFLGDDDPATELVLMGAAEFGYGPRATGMGINEFQQFLRETGFFLLGFGDTEDPNCSPHPPEIRIKSFTPGHPVLV